MLEQLLGPVVHNAGDERLHVAELAVDAEDEEHHKEDGGPEDGAGQREHQVRVGEENLGKDSVNWTSQNILGLYQAGAAVDNLVDGCLLDVGHVA